MNISFTNNYQSGFTYTPVVNKTSPEPVPQTSETGKNPQKENLSPAGSQTTVVDAQQLTQAELQLVEELKKIDAQVRQHEMAHVTAGGRYITSGANFTYNRGPDGKNYAVGGEVSIDTSPVPGDPQATIQKMRQVKSAALAPANPSSQDIRVASKATQAGSKALSDIMILQAKEYADSNEYKAFGNIKKAADSYEKVSHLPEDDLSSFQIAV